MHLVQTSWIIIIEFYSVLCIIVSCVLYVRGVGSCSELKMLHKLLADTFAGPKAMSNGLKLPSTDVCRVA